MSYTVLIPARMASTRLPGKPLLEIGGVPMVVRVAQRVISGIKDSSENPPAVIVAADDEKIIQACQQYGIKAILTDLHHASGSDRLAQACEILGLAGDDLVVNVQGDEPLIDPNLVAQVAKALQNDTSASMSTAAHTITEPADFFNPNVVKVVLNQKNHGIYFSRAPIPWWRDGFDASNTLASFNTKDDSVANSNSAEKNLLPAILPLRHIGIYAYKAGFLRQFPHLTPAPLEQLEALEQLRAIWHGHQIVVHLTQNAPAAGVDTPQDLERVRQFF